MWDNPRVLCITADLRARYAWLIFRQFTRETTYSDFLFWTLRNTPIQIYWKFHHQKLNFSDTNSLFFIFLLKNIDCGCSLEPVPVQVLQINPLPTTLWRPSDKNSAAINNRYLGFVKRAVWLHWSVANTWTTTLRKFRRLYTVARL